LLSRYRAHRNQANDCDCETHANYIHEKPPALRGCKKRVCNVVSEVRMIPAN
jgi:hypothetical protein